MGRARVIMLRLNQSIAPKFDALEGQFRLPAGTLVRLIINAMLEKPLSEQVAIVEAQLRAPASTSLPDPKAAPVPVARPGHVSEGMRHSQAQGLHNATIGITTTDPLIRRRGKTPTEYSLDGGIGRLFIPSEFRGSRPNVAQFPEIP